MPVERLTYIIEAHNRSNAVWQKVAGDIDGVRDKQQQLTKISREATGVSEKLTAARDKEADALGKIRVAEQNLSEVRGKANAKTSQIARAEEQLNRARRDAARATSAIAKEFEKAATPDGRKSGRSFTGGLVRWITGRGAKDVEGGGRFLANAFGSGFIGAARTPVIGPAIVAAVLAAVATVAPAVGAVAGGAIVAAFGAGLAGLALVFAAKSEAVRAVWRSTLTRMGRDMSELSRPFENVLTAMAAVASRTLARLKPKLAGAFVDLAPAMAGFGDQIGRAFERIGPAIRPVAQAFAAVAAELGPGLQSAVASIAVGMQLLSRSIKANPTALAEFVRGLGDLVRDLLIFLAVFNDADAAFRRFTGGTSLVTAVMNTLRIGMDLLLAPIALIAKGLSAIGDAMNWLAGKLGVGKEVSNQTADALKSAGAGADLLAASARTAAPVVDTLSAKIARQTANTDSLITSMHRLSGVALTLRGSQTGLAQATADATAAVAANGKTLTLNTQAGRDNRTALDRVAQAANDQYDAMVKAGKGTHAANIASLHAKDEFVKLATGMGLSKTAAKKLADQLIDTQRSIDLLHGKTVIVKYTAQGINTTSPSSVGRKATGGAIRGPGGDTSDRAGLFALSNNEYVVKAASARKYGDKAMGSVNAGTAQIIPGMAAGGPVVRIHEQGVFDSVAQAKLVLGRMFGGPALAFARSQVGKPYVWGGVGPNGYDCSGFLSAITNVLQGKNPYRRRFATGNLPAGLFVPGRGQFEIGWFKGNPGHTAGTLNGVNVESRGGRGVVVGPGARGAGDHLFTSGIHHLKGYAQGGKVKGDPPYDGFKDWLNNMQSYAKGTAYVPHDGLAYLHRGERVTPASQNRASAETVNINVNGTLLDRRTMDALLVELRKAVRSNGGDVQKVLGPGR